jgi:class 3 adenylate cyclase
MDTITCRSCGSEIRDEARFCPACGSPVETACPECGGPALAGDRFCAQCGASLATSPPGGSGPAASEPEPGPERVRERRFVSIMFCDLVGFTPLTESRDSEDVRDMLGRYFERVREIIERFDGLVEKYIGDAVMAVWGADVAHEDDAERAVRAALEAVGAVRELGDRLGIPNLQARAGVLSGEAAVSPGGNEGTGMVVGDIVNTASRLQSAAGPGTVLAGRPTMELARSAIEFSDAGTLEVKGKSTPMEAWKAERVIAGRQGTRRAEGIVPPFVDRTEELRLLKDSVHAVSRERRPRLVSLVGQAGIGKSRLVDELWNYTDGIGERVYWHHGRSPAYGDGISAWALGEMVRERCGIAAADDDHRARTKLRTALAELVPDPGDRAWIEPRLEGLLGLAEMPPGSTAELFAAWRMLFIRIAEQGPVVMAFEDLHWADDAVLDFIEELMAVVPDRPILIITLARPELLDRRPGWGSGHVNTVGLRLAPLAAETMEELIRAVVLDAPEALVDALVDKAGGIPLYAVELLRMLESRRLIVRHRESTYRVDGDIDTVAVPDSIQELIGARIDQLEGGQRSVLADCAILGQFFTIEGLRALRDEPEEQLTAALQPLVRQEILAMVRDPRSPERGRYRFVQSIFREIARRRISRSDRLARHLRIAEYFESLGDAEVAGFIAGHRLDALEIASPNEAETLRPLALTSLLQAADRAQGLGSHAQVMRMCERGLAHTEEAPERAELLLLTARSAHAAMDDSAEPSARSAMEQFTRAGDHEGELRAAIVLARQFNNTGRSNEAWPLLGDVLGDDEPQTAVVAEAMAELGRSYLIDHRPAQAIPWCNRALAIAERIDQVPVVTEALITKGSAIAFEDRLREATALLEAGLKLAREHQLILSKRRVLQNLDFLSSADRYGNPYYAHEALEDARRLGEPRYLAEATVRCAYYALGDYEWDRFDELMGSIDIDGWPAADRIGALQAEESKRMLVEDAAEGARRIEEAWKSLGDTGDQQVETLRIITRAFHAFYMGRHEEAYDLAMSVGYLGPGANQLELALWPALRLADPGRLRRILDSLDGRPYRGRIPDLLRSAVRGALAAIGGDTDEATRYFQTAVSLGDQALNTHSATVLRASAAAAVGSHHPLGTSWGREAYDVWASAGVTTMLERYRDAVIGPEPDVRSTTTG